MLDVIDYAPLQRVFQNILHAIEHRTVCLITYAAATKPVREHEMAPTNLMSGRQALYLHDEPKGSIIYCYVGQTYSSEDATVRIRKEFIKSLKQQDINIIPLFIVILHAAKQK